MHTLDQGEILLGGEPQRFETVQAALTAGIGAVYQERNLVPKLSVAENIFLHHPPSKHGFVSYKTMYADALPWLKRMGLAVDPRLLAERLSVAQSQLVEIARTLALDTQILLLDEPTASLSARETGSLFSILDELRTSGHTILFVSHRLDEVMSICDDVTVLRDGKTVLDGAPKEDLSKPKLITAMVGREIELAHNRTSYVDDTQPPAFTLKGVTTQAGHRDVDLSVRPGEIVGMYGLVGAGRTELFSCLLGEGRITSGEIRVDGSPVTIRSPYDALNTHRIGYVSEDRKRLGLILKHSISHNVAITIWTRLATRLGFVTERKEWLAVLDVTRAMDVKMSSPSQLVGQLSGGNQQKVSLAKWISTDVDVLIVDEPTIGVDVRTKEEIYVLLDQLAQAGKAIIVISSDLSEVVRLADTIVVMAGYRIVGSLENTGDYTALSSEIMSDIITAESKRVGVQP